MNKNKKGYIKKIKGRIEKIDYIKKKKSEISLKNHI